MFDHASMVVWLAGGILFSLLAAAMIADFSRRRIPNLIVVAGLVLGLGLNALLPEGFGLFNRYAPGGLGLLGGIGGALVGGGLLLPLYLVRAMGAGDVKLMAMVGAFLSPMPALRAVLVVLLVGGLFSLAFAFNKGVLRQTFRHLRLIFVGAFSSLLLRESPDMSVTGETAGRMPYGLSITIGTVTYLLLQYHGWMAG